MSDEETIDSLDLMAQSIDLVQDRFSKIHAPDDFVVTLEGVTLLDAISMRLQVIGESVKQILKTNPSFLEQYPEIEWERIARFRDFVSHHYDRIDHEIVYDICREQIPKLGHAVQKMRASLRRS